MSTVKNQTELSGMLGESVSVRKLNGRVVLTNRPKRRMLNSTDKQTAVREKFLEASQYANRQMQLEDARALYAEGITKRKASAYVVALCDYLTAPVVKSIDTLSYRGAIGDKLVIKAVDDFKVTKVKIVITNAAGAIIEEGEAQPDAEKANLWEYEARVGNPTLVGTKIQAVAYDRPGNTGTAEIVL